MSLFEELEANCPRPARQRSDAKERRRAIVANIVASLAVLIQWHPDGTRLAISADNKALTRYDRPNFSREVFLQIVDEMEERGLLVRHRGAWRKRRTAIEPATRFCQMVAGMNIQIGREAGAETVLLKANTGRDRPKVFIDYEDTAETNAMRAEMADVNAVLARTAITLAGKPPTPPPFLTRRFQIEHPKAPHTFDQHGRLYGGFWMSLPKSERHLLRVSGEPIADLDFTGMFVQLAYLGAGLALPNGDPYEGVEGLPRAAVKLGLSALLCRSGAMQRLPTGLRAAVGPEWNARRLSATVAERHPGIAHLFGSGIGLRLMKTESDILLATLRDLFAQRIPALAMHDGIMVPVSKEKEARRAMVRASALIVGVALPVARKAIGIAKSNNSLPMD